jgi:uncharacterized protein YfcZ (UPF0381/DUF406 family)
MKLVYMDRTIQHILSSASHRIKEVEALGVPVTVELEDRSDGVKIDKYFVFEMDNERDKDFIIT